MSQKLDNLSKDQLKALLKKLLEDDVPMPKKRGRPSKQPRESIRGNKFEAMEDLKDAFKEDTEIDKLLWKGRVPSVRRRPINLISVKCRDCNENFDIQPEASTESNLCNKCIVKLKS
jgi:hypothetical protein